MVIAIVAVMFLSLIGISYYAEKKRQSAASTVPVKSASSASEMYLHPSHTFVRVGASDTVEIGMDAFAQRAFGAVDVTILPEIGTQLKQGDRLWNLKIGDRCVSQRMPVQGTITEVDKQEGTGWIIRATASNLKSDLANLIKSGSVVPWLKKARAKFVSDYTGELMPALQDGGELAEGFAQHLNDEQWDQFCKEFFNCEHI